MGTSKVEPASPDLLNKVADTMVKKAPNFTERDGDNYMYISGVSEEDKRQGRAVGDVLTYRYLGVQNGKHVLQGVSDAGTKTARFECADPCKIIKMTSGALVSRMPYDPASVVGSAFEDALAGNLEVASGRAEAAAAPKAEVIIPAAFVGEWNSDLAACGTGLNDSRLRISPSEVQFYESTGKVTKVQTGRAGTATVTGSFSGEGEQWTDSFKMALSPSGRELTIDGLVRHRCPA